MEAPMIIPKFGGQKLDFNLGIGLNAGNDICKKGEGAGVEVIPITDELLCNNHDDRKWMNGACYGTGTVKQSQCESIAFHKWDGDECLLKMNEKDCEKSKI